MAVVIRLKRTGRRNRPCYRISVADSRFPRDGRVLDNLGVYDPIRVDKESQSTLDVEKARKWLSEGAQPSETVRSVFKRHGVFTDWSLPSKPRKRPGRKKTTATGTKRRADQKVRADRKSARQAERLSSKRAAAKAEASADSEE